RLRAAGGEMGRHPAHLRGLRRHAGRAARARRVPARHAEERKAGAVSTEAAPARAATASPPGSLSGLVRYFLWLGATGFGGPTALVGFMQRALVEERGWFTAEEYREGLALAQLAPGPLAAQLAMYLGWARGGAGGAALVGVAFVLPSFAMVVALAIGYLRFGGLAWMQGAFYGIGAAVVAIIARRAVKLTRRARGVDGLLWALLAVGAVVPGWTESGIVWVFLGAGAVAAMVRVWPRRWRAGALGLALLPPGFVAGLAGPATAETIWRIGWYFA